MTLAKGIRTPAQVGYDEKRGRAIIPVLEEQMVIFFPLEVGKG